MSYTNTTSHYSLPQYVGSDKPKYLTDFNEAMATIDGQMYDNATAASTADSKADAAQSTADANTSSISALDTQINGATGLAADVAANQGAITTINSLIGNGTPTTTDKTIIGAINELHTDVQAEDTKVGDLANLATTDKTSVVAAVNEVAGAKVLVSATADGVKTQGELLAELFAGITLDVPSISKTRLRIGNGIYMPTLCSASAQKVQYSSANGTGQGLNITTATLAATGTFVGVGIAGDGTVTITDASSEVASSGTVYAIIA